MKPKGIAQRKARLDARRASLSREKLARLETTLQTVSAEGPLNTIPTRPIEGPVLCSFAQRRLWFLDQLNPGEVVYNLAMAVHLEGALSSDGLEQAVNEIVRRHESLRSSFLQLDGEPFQVIAPFRIRAFGLVDLGGLSETAALATSRRLAAEERNRPYDLSKDSLLRFTLLRAQAEKHAVFFTMHHIVSDAWSMGVFIREIGALYDAFCTGRPSPLRELPIQYADYSYWQRQWMQGELLTAEISYWARQLAGVSALELPIDRPRPAVQTSRGGSKVVTLSEDVTNRLRRLSRREDATMFMALLTAFQILLMRYSGSDDIAVGTPVAGRSRVETEGLIGFFINTLVIRTKLSGDPTLRQLVGRAREVVLDAQTHQHLPFERIVEELHPERSLSRSPIFQVMFSLPNAPGGALKSEVEAASPIDRLNFSGIGGRQGLVKFDLTLSMGELPDRLSGCFDYNADLFDDISIERMAAHFKNVIEAMVTAPDLRLSALSLLDDGQTHQLLTEWNDAKAEYERRLCVHELIEEQTNRTPDRIAVEFEEERLSYHELNARTDRLAQLLRSLGVRAEVIVGICLERSIELPVGLIGIWKAGGAYLPLEPSLPNARLLEMLGNAEAPVLVTSQKLSERLQGSRAKIVCLDADVVTPPSVEAVASGVSGESLAYLIYTSGSTGQPKGVMNTHRGLLNRLVWMQEQYGLAESDVVIQKTPFGFDVSVWEFFWPLMAGARLVMARPDGHKDSGYLVELITKLRVTTAHFVPSMLRVFIAERGVEKCKSLKRVICSGEAMVNDLYEKFSAQMRMPLENLYGPTEAAIDVTYWRCEGECNQRVIPIGRPVANTRIHIVDGEATPVGIAVRGELQIGGVQLARGYLKRPDLTAEKFVPDAVGTGIGERLYKTGDLACYRADGAIEFLGRLDHQVKIRGFRIELGEIEVVLSDHPWVREAVVIAREDRFGDRRLVAYVVGRGELESWEEEMSRYLRERLPEYMAPSVWVRIESLPLNQNGKIEKRALPEPEPAAKRQISTPETWAEELLAGIWAQLLDLERVGRGDDFFRLGGHSLLATRVISRLRENLGIELPLRSVFEAPTLSGMAKKIEEAVRAGRRTTAPAMTPVPRNVPLPLSYAQQRLWLLHQLIPGSSAWTIASAVSLGSDELPIVALEESVSEITRRHETLRTTFPRLDGEAAQFIGPFRRITFPLVDLSNLTEKECQVEVDHFAAREMGRPFDLAVGPLMRITLLRGAGRSFLHFSMDHLVTDEWSMGLLNREVREIYEEYRKGLPSPLQELVIQYADYAVWQREYLSGDILKAHLSYWLPQLAGIPPLLELPTDRPRPAVKTYRGASRFFTLSGSLSDSLSALSHEANVTLFMTLLAALQILLWRHSGQEDVCVGSPIAGRNQIETERLIGYFINNLALRTDLSGNPTIRELFNRVREVSLGAYAHQDLPFELLIEESDSHRSLAYSPIFQVFFNFHNASTVSTGELPAAESFEIETTTARFDLSLIVTRTDYGLRCGFEYSKDLFDSTRIKSMADHYQTVLTQMVENPERRIEEMSLLTHAEREMIVGQWNETAAPHTCSESISAIFEEQSDLTPDLVVVEDDSQQLSYGELNRRSNQLAHHLRRIGVTAEGLVGISMERSADLMVGLLGILKTGAAYLPLDPSHPRERLLNMLEDSGVEVLVTLHWVVRWMPDKKVRIVRLDADWDAVSQESSSNPKVKIDSRNAAYVIYTSGSTGRPKGVVGLQSGAINRFQWMWKNYPFQDDDVCCQKTTLNFVDSIWEIFGPMLKGIRVCVISDEVVRNPLRLVETLKERAITRIVLVPSLLRLLLESGAGLERRLNGIRLWVTSGEALTVDLAESFLQLMPQSRLLNLYGSSEVSADVTFFDVGAWAAKQMSVPVGRPLSNNSIYILDKYEQPVPVGHRGELRVGGAGLARGYLGRPELTAEKFTPDHLGGKPGGRIYHTGDAAQYRSDGIIELTGRMDHQVKLRGFRIEPGEIETALMRHPDVRQAVVIAIGDSSEDKENKRLRAYVTAQEGREVTAAQLQNYLRNHLPDYMVPAEFHAIESLPITPNGKVNRAALLERGDHSIANREFIEPRDLMELRIAAIWKKVLNVRQVGVTENFFELGGNSLTAIRIVTQIQKQFGETLDLNVIMQMGNVANLAKLLSDRLGPLPYSPLVPLQTEGSRPPFFIVHGMGGEVMGFYTLARYLGTDQPFYALQGPLDNRFVDPERSVEKVAEEYIEALREVQPEGPYFLGGLSWGGIVAFEMARQLLARHQAVAFLAVLDTLSPLILRQMPQSTESSLLIVFARLHGLELDDRLLRFYGDPRQEDGEDRHRLMFEQLKKAGLINDAFSEEGGVAYIRAYVRGLMARAIAIRRYNALAFAGKITFFRAESDHSQIEAYRKMGVNTDESEFGWGRFTTEPLEICDIPGFHWKIMVEPYVQVLAERLRARIDRAMPTQPATTATDRRSSIAHELLSHDQ